jgi:class 3 adenylate cyclase
LFGHKDKETESSTQDLIRELERLRGAVKFMDENEMELATVIGQLSEEKHRAEQAFEREHSATLQLVGQLHRDVDKREREKQVIEENALEILRTLAEVNEERKKAEEERLMIEQSSMELIRNLAEIDEERKKAEEASRRVAEEREMLEKAGLEYAQMIAEMGIEHKKVEEINALLKRITLEASRSRLAVKNLLNKIFPAEIAEELISGKAPFQKLRITVAFSDLEGFSSYSAKLPPEKIGSELKRYFTEMTQVVEHHNGWVVKYIGDAVMMMFGVPKPTRSHEIEAAVCALRQMEHMVNFPWGLRLGIHTGDAVVGDLGSPRRPQYDCMGDTVNIAARLEEFAGAEKRTIVVSEETAKPLQNAFELRGLGRRTMKGVGAIETFELVGVKRIMSNPIRVRATSMFRSRYTNLEHEVENEKKNLFPRFDFLRLESYDGAIGHSTAVPMLALALADHTRTKIDREALLVAGFLHDVGKLYVPRELLSKSPLTKEEMERVRRIPQYSVATIAKLGRFKSAIPIIREMCSDIAEVRPEAEFLRIANMYDAMTCPKLYKSGPGPSTESVLASILETYPSRAASGFKELMG